MPHYLTSKSCSGGLCCMCVPMTNPPGVSTWPLHTFRLFLLFSLYLGSSHRDPMSHLHCPLLPSHRLISSLLINQRYLKTTFTYHGDQRCLAMLHPDVWAQKSPSEYMLHKTNPQQPWLKTSQGGSHVSPAIHLYKKPEAERLQ